MTTIEELRHTANCLADSADEALLIKAAEELEALQRRCDMLLIQQTHDENARADLKDVITAINFEVADLRTQNRELREALELVRQEHLRCMQEVQEVGHIQLDALREAAQIVCKESDQNLISFPLWAARQAILARVKELESDASH